MDDVVATRVEARAARITALVSSARRRLVAAALGTGSLLAAGLAMAWVAAGVMLDLVAPLPVALRTLVHAGWWCAVAAGAVLFVLLPAVRRPVLESVALRIEKLLGGIQNRLLTVVDLHRGGAATRGWRDDPARRGMAERLVAQTEQRLFGLSPGAVVRLGAILRGMAIAGLAAAVLAGLWAALGERFTLTLARLADPGADIPPATWNRLETAGDIEVLEGEPFDLVATVTRGVVDSAALVIVSPDGTERREPMHARSASSGFTATLDGLRGDVRYRVEGGGTWTRTSTIRVLERPAIESAEAVVRLPAYMRIAEPIVVAGDAARIEAPLGAEVEFVAEVAGEPERGAVRILTRSLETTLVERFDERVWFEDDLPRDAVSSVAWKWTTAQAAGGLRSFAFPADGRALEMRTRLDPLVLPKEGLADRFLTLMSRGDAADPPSRLTVRFVHEGGAVELVWGDEAAGPAADLRVPRIVVGPLPPPGGWERLAVALEKVPQLVGRTVEGLELEIDRGRMLLDRPGWMERSMQPVERPVDRLLGEIAAARGDEASRRWTARVPVGDARRVAGDTDPATEAGGDTRPVWAALAFTDRNGHSSREVAPVEIAATVDGPPSLVVEEPQSELLQISALDDIRVVAHLFDDWGIDAVAVRVGADEGSLGEPLPLVEAALSHTPPDTQAVLETVLSADRLGLAPGGNGALAIAVRDTKGQWTESRAFRVVVIADDAAPPDPPEVPVLEEAMRRAAEALRAADADAAAFDGKRDAVLEAVGREALAALDAAESAATAREEAAAAAARAATEPGATPESKAAAERSRQSAEDAARATAEEAQRTADAAAAGLPDPRKQDFDALDRFLDERKRDAAGLAATLAGAAEQARGARGVSDEQAAVLGEASRAAAALGASIEASPPFRDGAARIDRLADSPKPSEIGRRLEEIARMTRGVALQLEAGEKSRRLESLADDLAGRAQSLDALGERRRDERTRDGRGPDDAERKALDRRGREESRQVGEIVGEEARREPPPTDPNDPLDALMEQSREAAREAAETAARIASELAGRESPRGDSARGGQEPGSSPTGAEGQAAARPGGAEPGREAPESAGGAPTPEQVEALLGRRDVQDALRMADRARRLGARETRRAAERLAQEQARASQQEGQGEGQPGATPTGEPTQTPTDGGAQAGQAAVKEADLRGLDAARRAAIYKLPPRVRDPLLEGMRERGPAAYQEVIDTYFRHLGRDLPP